MFDVLDSPSLPFACGFLNSDRRELSKASLSVDYHICVSKEGLLKRKILFQSRVLKDFHAFGLLSFEKSVEEMMLRAEVFTFGDLDLY